MRTTYDLAAYEKLILTIIHTLPIERVAQLADFARYLQGQTDAINLFDETDEEIEADEAIWDAQFASSEKLFSHMAAKVRADIAAGPQTGQFQEI